jgi:hypothetical protein
VLDERTGVIGRAQVCAHRQPALTSPSLVRHSAVMVCLNQGLWAISPPLGACRVSRVISDFDTGVMTLLKGVVLGSIDSSDWEHRVYRNQNDGRECS